MNKEIFKELIRIEIKNLFSLQGALMGCVDMEVKKRFEWGEFVIGALNYLLTLNEKFEEYLEDFDLDKYAEKQ